jgi:monothiol glutaredoxin
LYCDGCGRRRRKKVSINERIEQQLNEFPVLLYMKGSPDFPQCGFSAQVVGALKECEKRFAFVNILEDAELRQGLKEYSQWPTFPQLFVKGELIGGCDIIVQMFESGELKKTLDAIE